MARLAGFAIGVCALVALGHCGSLLASPAYEGETSPVDTQVYALDGQPQAALPDAALAEFPPDSPQAHAEVDGHWEPWWRARRWHPPLSEDWQVNPYTASLFAGPIWGEEIEADTVRLGSGLISGVRFGRDFDPRWGFEGRLALATFGASSLVTNGPLPDADLLLADVHFLAYWEWSPRLHPFFSIGTGLAMWDYSDVGAPTTETTLVFPIGVGLKYSHDHRMGVRIDLQDNISLAQQAGIDTVHTTTLNFGFEFRFGGRRPSYDSWAR